ncbi:hypothetical protein A3L11_05185 [Thermococcus siculi]|uniref:Uncharacterized protein n=1 Tax=Thermococcus siculi TaxID=72803 RepID=A0A2Z2MWW1_9EURY|nr:hypothetical protein [Thermococcus siculi]ASJ08653.1 hypothetical protein A3L11_05185 [Thermococcus siculi]
MLPISELEQILEWVKKNSKNSIDLFRVPHTAWVTHPDAKISLEMPVLVDFPRIAYETIGTFIVNYASEKTKENGLREGLREILEKKEDSNTPIGYATSVLRTLGIEWDAYPLGEKLILSVDPDEYYKNVWPHKILSFVKLLNEGQDYPSNIYEVASILTPQLPIDSIPTPSKVALPVIFFNFGATTAFNAVIELDALKNRILQLYTLIISTNETPEDYGRQIITKNHLMKIFTDMFTIVQHLELLLESGHFHSGYYLMRSLIRDLGDALLTASLIQYYSLIAPKLDETVLTEETKEDAVWSGLTYVDENFIEKWLRVYYDSYGRPFVGDAILENPKEESKEWKIKSLSNLRDELKKGMFYQLFSTGFIERKVNKKVQKYSVVGFSDRVCYESVDMFIKTGKFPIDVVLDEHIKLPTKANLKDASQFLVSNEYHKLSDVVHNPVLVDFPPYSSTIEYLGFLHHLKILRKIFDNVLRVYLERRKRERKIMRKEEKN